MEYREITSKDTDEIKQMAKIFMGAFNAPPWNDSWSEESAEERLTMMLDGRAAYGIAAYDNGKMTAGAVGCFERYCEKTVFNLREFFVDRSIKGKGIGTEFFKETERRLKEKGVNEITLNTLKTEKTESFYLKQGMKNEEEMTVMVKRLI